MTWLLPLSELTPNHSPHCSGHGLSVPEGFKAFLPLHCCIPSAWTALPPALPMATPSFLEVSVQVLSVQRSFPYRMALPVTISFIQFISFIALTAIFNYLTDLFTCLFIVCSFLDYRIMRAGASH